MSDAPFFCRNVPVTLTVSGKPDVLFLLPADERDGGREADLLYETGRPFALARFPVEDWNRDLSPWPAAPVYGKEPFAGQGEATLSFILDDLLPALKEKTGGLPVVLGGYSLAGLFALWASTKTDAFFAVNAASPSAWYPGLLPYLDEHPPRCQRLALSLGDKEGRTKHPVMKTVETNLREIYASLSKTMDVTLTFHPGGHFQDADRRTVAGFLALTESEKTGFATLQAPPAGL